MDIDEISPLSSTRNSDIGDDVEELEEEVLMEQDNHSAVNSNDDKGIKYQVTPLQESVDRQKHFSSLQPNADKCKSYDILPYVAAIHTSPIYSVDATKCMKFLFTGTSDGTIYKYDFFSSMNGKTVLTVAQRHMFVDSVTKAGTMTSYWFNEERSPDDINTLLDVSPVYSLAVHSEALWGVSGLQSGAINLFTIRHDEGHIGHVFRKHTNVVSALQLSKDETTMLSGSWDTDIHLWDLNTGAALSKYNTHGSQISSISLYPTSDDSNSQIFMSTSIDGACCIWDTRIPKEPVKKLELAEKTPPWSLSACWSPNGKHVYIGRRNCTVDEYDFTEGSHIRPLKLPNNSGPVSHVLCLPNNSQLLCGSVDNIRMWDLSMDTTSKTVPFSIIPGHHGGVLSSILLDSTSKYMITTSGNRGWDGLETNACLFYEVKPVM